MKYRIKSPGKINLWLKVRGKREDGYHDLETAFCQIDLKDYLHWEPGEGELTLEMKGAAMDNPRDNLVFKAAKLFTRETGIKIGGQMLLEKRIPMGAGLGGGSSNAATALKLFNRHHDNPLGDEKLADLALELGSDVPFFLKGGAQLGKGRGEVLSPAPLPRSLPLGGFLIMPKLHMSTKKVFETFDTMPPPPPFRKPIPEFGPIRRDRWDDFKPWLDEMPREGPCLGENDLVYAACKAYPEFEKYYNGLKSCTFRKGAFFMTGSGSTMVWLVNGVGHFEVRGLFRPHDWLSFYLNPENRNW
ncbi:MAG: 4-(cytidine 5'-diphospho)-2-C-methyl-D-erythritol kinase [Acidobacteriota bacterium]|nr:4-(cytidine 5'-diphospho)-2-C-methyl-D-erythritol kinase [Acidobacteriota bacterium]